jgi:hypothetical protein
MTMTGEEWIDASAWINDGRLTGPLLLIERVLDECDLTRRTRDQRGVK